MTEAERLAELADFFAAQPVRNIGTSIGGVPAIETTISPEQRNELVAALRRSTPQEPADLDERLQAAFVGLRCGLSGATGKTLQPGETIVAATPAPDTLRAFIEAQKPLEPDIADAIQRFVNTPAPRRWAYATD